MSPVEHVRHLARRFVGMLSNEPIPAVDRCWAEDVLTAPEAELWARLAVADQRHSIEVGRRFVQFAPQADRSAVAAALVHDIGKLDSNLGVGMRVVATIVGPRTARLRRYHDHERIGGSMLRRIGADERTVALVERTSADAEMAAALLAADNI
ncbi:MAG: hypothetical protein ABIR32_09100 [Ilumatobacteraceae bacterium]